MGQVYVAGGAPRLLVDGRSGVNIVGNTAALQRGFYRLTGVYDGDTNTLNVTEFTQEEVKYLAIQAGKELGINLVPVSVEGLIATTPKEVANMLTSYVSIPDFPQDVPIYPYVVYAKDGFYLALLDSLVSLPAEITFLYQGRDYGFTFSAGEVRGTLVKTPVGEINLGVKWQPNEFGGVIIAESLQASEPVTADVRAILSDPASFAFKRVSINGTYLVATSTIDYSEIQVPFGVGVLADSPTELFFEEEGPRLETVDPERNVWQLRQAQVVGTVLYPTEEVLKYLDYSAPLTRQETRERAKPALLVDTLVDDAMDVADVSELNPLTGNPHRYWGKVVEFDGYALGVNIRLKDVVEAIAQTEIPVNVNMLAIGIADSPMLGSQLAIIGLNNELLGKGGETIVGRFKFRVAVTEMPVKLVDIESANTAFFLLSKEELPIEMPTEVYTLSISISPSGAGSVAPSGGDFVFGTPITLTAVPAPGYTFDHWSGNASGGDNPVTITMDSDKRVTAHFRAIPAPTPTPVPTPSPTPLPTPTPPPPPPPTPTPTPTSAALTGRIAFTSYRGGPERDIYVMNPDGSGVIRLTDDPAKDLWPSWSPDGSRIAFDSDRDGNHEIYVMNADGSGVTRLTNNAATDDTPAWSPDGSRIAFSSLRDGNREIYVMNADGSEQARLTTNGAEDWAPSWSPDGQRIAFASNRDGDWDIYVINADGSGLINLSNSSSQDSFPAWSPDGLRIAFESLGQVYLMNADGSQRTQLTTIGAGDYGPAWSPDGLHLVFTSNRDGNWEIYVINVDGSGLLRITKHSSEDYRPAWGP